MDSERFMLVPIMVWFIVALLLKLFHNQHCLCSTFDSFHWDLGFFINDQVPDCPLPSLLGFGPNNNRVKLNFIGYLFLCWLHNNVTRDFPTSSCTTLMEMLMLCQMKFTAMLVNNSFTLKLIMMNTEPD